MGYEIQSVVCEHHVNDFIERLSVSGNLDQIQVRHTWLSAFVEEQPPKMPAIHQCVDLSCSFRAARLHPAIIPFTRVVEVPSSG